VTIGGGNHRGIGTVLTKLDSFEERLRSEASEWHATPGVAAFLFVLPLAGSVAIILARADKSVYRFLTDEDSVLEWPQVFGLAAACIFALLCAWRLHGSHRSLVALAYLAFALGCFFVAGEEIAWGERLIGYGTPEALEEINEQRETTVHNIDVVQQFTNLTYLIAGLYGSIGAWIVRGRNMWRRSDLVDLLLPPIFLTTAFFVMFAYKALRFAFFRESGFTVTRAGEWAELCLALGFSVFAFLQWRRLADVEGS
jgi:uncharacterized membrane protein